jgi:hypothetical protein
MFEDNFNSNFDKLHKDEHVNPGENKDIVAQQSAHSSKGLKKQSGEILELNPGWFFNRWEPRYAVLENKKFKYFENEEDKIPIAVLNFDLFEAVTDKVQSDKLQFNLSLKGQDLKFHFKANLLESSNAWQGQLNKHIRQSDGFKHMKSAINSIEPWKSDVFSEQQFIQESQTGDLLLFQGNMSGPMLIRTLTGSEFDHVAMILRFDSQDDVYIVEATGNNGVTYNKWSNIRDHIGPGKFYAKLVYRQVKM